MSKLWSLTQKTFTPAQAAAITGVAAGTQRQWWRRGFLGERSGGNARVTLSEIAAMFALQRCAEVRINLDFAAKAIPALSRSALYRMALATTPWHFVGPDAEKDNYLNWIASEEREGDHYILDMLHFNRDDLKRYTVLTHIQILKLDNLVQISDQEHWSPVILLDSWGIGSSIIARTTDDLFVARRIGKGGSDE